jgi:ketosteroid isomerase-like protein
MTDREQVAGWIDAYERAWRTAGTTGLVDLFTADATYRQDPYETPFVGLPAVQEMWEAERDGPDEPFTMTYEIVAVDGDTAVARVDVRYGTPLSEEYADLWLIWLAPDGRCRRFEEWPFWPDRLTSGSQA